MKRNGIIGHLFRLSQRGEEKGPIIPVSWPFFGHYTMKRSELAIFSENFTTQKKACKIKISGSRP